MSANGLAATGSNKDSIALLSLEVHHAVHKRRGEQEMGVVIQRRLAVELVIHPVASQLKDTPLPVIVRSKENRTASLPDSTRNGYVFSFHHKIPWKYEVIVIVRIVAIR